MIFQEEQFLKPEFVELQNLRDAVEQHQRAARERLSKNDELNRKFFQKAASQTVADADSRKLVKLVRAYIYIYIYMVRARSTGLCFCDACDSGEQAES
jgi:hypothetical protein